MPKPAEVTVPSDREVRVTRTFNAPRQLVWDAHTKPELVRKWQGYDGWDMPVCDMDIRSQRPVEDCPRRILRPGRYGLRHASWRSLHRVT